MNEHWSLLPMVPREGARRCAYCHQDLFASYGYCYATDLLKRNRRGVRELCGLCVFRWDIAWWVFNLLAHPF